MELQILESAEFLPNGCTLCHTHEGPFVWIPGINFFDVPSADGRVTVEGAIALCVGFTDPDNAHNDQLGCARLIGRAAGCLTPGEAEGLKAHARAALVRAEELDNELQACHVKLAEAEQRQTRVVPVAELVDFLNEDAAPLPASVDRPAAA